MSNKVTLKIEFPSQEYLDAFTCWLCEEGEQDFWQWEEGKNNPRMVDFIYHHPQDEQFPKTDSRRYIPSKFCRDNIILTEEK